MATVPKLAGSYFDWETEGRTAAVASIGSTVAVAATADWGPLNETVTLYPDDMYGEFGEGDSPLHRAIRDAFKGQGTGGKAGASAVVAYRQGVASGGGQAVKAVKTLANTGAATALTLTAKHFGTRANSFRFTVQAAAGGGNELLILDGTYVVARYQHVATDITGLAAAINLSDDWFDAVANVNGVALAAVSGASPTTNGVDGATLTGTEWTNTMVALDRDPWAIFAAYGLTDSTIRASLVSWIKSRNSNGVRSFLVVGGASGESLATASSRSVTINHWDVLNLGRGTLHLVDEDRDVSTAEFVARYAGARAWRGEGRDDVFVRFGDVELTDGPSLAEEEQALDGGVIVFSRDRNRDAPVFIREAVTTYVDDSQSTQDGDGNKTHPVRFENGTKAYASVKNVATQHGIETEVSDWATNGDVLGELPVDDKTRELILGRVRLAYSTREAARVVQPGWTVSTYGPQDDDNDYVSYLHGFHPTRSLRQILHVARVG